MARLHVHLTGSRYESTVIYSTSPYMFLYNVCYFIWRVFASSTRVPHSNAHTHTPIETQFTKAVCISANNNNNPKNRSTVCCCELATLVTLPLLVYYSFAYFFLHFKFHIFFLSFSTKSPLTFFFIRKLMAVCIREKWCKLYNSSIWSPDSYKISEYFKVKATGSRRRV